MNMKRSFTFVIAALITALSVEAQSVTTLMQEGETLEKNFKESQALFKYKEVLKLEPTNYKALCKCSWLSNTNGFRMDDSKKKKVYYKQGLSYANAALKVDPEGAEANYLVAMSAGRYAQLSSPKERVASITTIKKYALEAIRYDPEHALAHHILGRLNYRISNMSTAEKAAANILFGGIPKGFSNEKAVAYYQKAVQLDPTYILFQRDLAIAYAKVNNMEKTKFHLNKALALPIGTPDDEQFKNDCRKMLSKLEK